MNDDNEMRQDDNYDEQVDTDDYVQSEPDKSFFKKHKDKIFIAGAFIIIALVAVFILTQMSEPEPEPEPVEEYVEPPFVYPPETVQALRSWGYTGDEIESYQAQKKDANELVAESKKLQEDRFLETYKELDEKARDSKSEVYQELLNNSFLIQKPVLFNPVNVTDTVDSYVYKSNVNYKKVPARGGQTFLQLESNNGNIYYMEIPPYRYYQLRDEGNIVVEFTSVTLHNETGEEFSYFFGFKEVEI